jgi:alpha-L-fucosidase
MAREAPTRPQKLETGEFMKRYEVTDYVDRAKSDQAIIECFFTAKGADLYAIVPRWPGRQLVVKDVSAPAGMKVSMLGTPGTLKWKAKGKNVIVEMPPPVGDPAKTQWAYVVKFEGLGR